MSQRNRTTDIPPQAFELYDQYAHGAINRRQFLRGLTGVAVGGYTATTLMSALLPNYALAEQVSFNDPDIRPSYQTFNSPKGHGEGRGYLVYPSELTGPAPVVLVVHENRGLNPYIKDVARRLAKAGFIAFAPDALHPVGGYPGNDDEGRALQAGLDGEKVFADLVAAAEHARAVENSNGKLGVVGFCFGGSVTNRLAAEHFDLIQAAVPYYGSPADLDTVKNIQAPVQIHLGELDQRINSQYSEYEKALEEHGVNYEIFTYEGANHGFHNDSTPRYDKEAAELAWSRTIDFFKKHLEK
ncbi:dienelactone hydrolase family protein [Marinimicrobium sp. LS-A18]|uniref:dienelactone hydrolase family protein n=1 Tax=Marinimicrobium sp. LS-A18 TaxID=1381596 RepID=UPI000464F8D1|nr:dienelactone hydrolase family protein [Marinimicrobium sp. LS-A18]